MCSSSATRRLAAPGLALLFLACALPGKADDATDSGSRLIHGSVVKVHQAGAADAPVVARLLENAPVNLVHGGGDWCEISWGAQQQKHGFVACALLAASAGAAQSASKPPVAAKSASARSGAAEAQPSPLEAFSLKPDLATFQDAGLYLNQTRLSAAELQAERPGLAPPAPGQGEAPAADITQAPQRPVVPEFEAMKRRLGEGVSAAPELWQPPMPWSELIGFARRSGTYDPAAPAVAAAYNRAAEYLAVDLQIPLPEARPSWFKAAQDAGRPSADARELSAQFVSSPYVARVIGPAHWVKPAQGQPWVYGAWDAGAISMHLAEPVRELLLDARGQLSIQRTLVGSTLDHGDGEGAPACADPGLGQWSFARADFAATPGEAAYPVALLRFKLPLDLAHAKVEKQEVTLAARPKNKLPFQHGTLTVIDLDGDSIPDLALWDGYRPLPGQADDTPAPLLYRMVLANIAGAWTVLDKDHWNECSDLAGGP